jgi:hypothetical protein
MLLANAGTTTAGAICLGGFQNPKPKSNDQQKEDIVPLRTLYDLGELEQFPDVSR